VGELEGKFRYSSPKADEVERAVGMQPSGDIVAGTVADCRWVSTIERGFSNEFLLRSCLYKLQFHRTNFQL
jgi:hypothetical protein